MTFSEILYSILIYPLQLFFENVYVVTNDSIHNPGLSIVVLSIAVNLLVLPLYRRADAIQAEQRDIEAKLADGIAHIKKTFKGDERMMILQTYYRQNNYRPTDVFKGSVSLFLQIPFFIAAYRFLSNLPLIQNESFLGIKNLGAPDQLLSFGGLHINLLPLLMTAINLITGVIVTKGFPLKSKIQLYALAGFFMVFLYHSPSGLVLYWTLNNLFSLVKNLFLKLKDPKRAGILLLTCVGTALCVFSISIFYHQVNPHRRIMVFGIGLCALLPALVGEIKKRYPSLVKPISFKTNTKNFLAGSAYLITLTGLLIPASVIKASPQEFVDISHFFHPAWYVFSAFCISFGTFGVWMGIFRWLSDKKYKPVFDAVIFAACVCMTVNYMFFARDLGILSRTLSFEDGLSFSLKSYILNLFINGFVLCLTLFFFYRKRQLCMNIEILACISMLIMSGQNLMNVHLSISEAKKNIVLSDEKMPNITLSRDGKNVILLMMDRAMNLYLPFIVNERPELKEIFSGFTYYANTLSYGPCTNIGVPALYGGYEYTPLEINKRADESLVSKHNEALKVLPVLFSRNGFHVTVGDPSLAGYHWIPDLSIYDEYPDIDAYHFSGRFNTEGDDTVVAALKRNLFMYSLMKTNPEVVQLVIYNQGQYNSSALSSQVMSRGSKYAAKGINKDFMDDYSVLVNLPDITSIDIGEKNTFFMLSNKTTHNEMLLQEPEYEPREAVDNTEFEEANPERFSLNGVTLNTPKAFHYMLYQVNMAALLKLGEWFDFLKEQQVYDNTRIIICADHGFATAQYENMVAEGTEELRSVLNGQDYEWYYPLLMVKDFNSKNFSVSEQFMTNADVPTIALSGLVDDPINPFTGKKIDDSMKSEKVQYIYTPKSDPYYWNISMNNGNQYNPAPWCTVHTDVRDRSNWKKVADDAYFPVNP